MKQSKSMDVKQMIIENFIDWFTSNEGVREQMKDAADIYISEDHVDEVQSFVEQLANQESESEPEADGDDDYMKRIREQTKQGARDFKNSFEKETQYNNYFINILRVLKDWNEEQKQRWPLEWNEMRVSRLEEYRLLHNLPKPLKQHFLNPTRKYAIYDHRNGAVFKHRCYDIVKIKELGKSIGVEVLIGGYMESTYFYCKDSQLAQFGDILKDFSIKYIDVENLKKNMYSRTKVLHSTPFNRKLAELAEANNEVKRLKAEIEKMQREAQDEN